MTPPRAKPKIVCECLGVTEAQLDAAVERQGLRTLKQVQACTEAGSGCTACHPAIREHLARARARQAAAAAAAPSYSAESSPSFSAR